MYVERCRQNEPAERHTHQHVRYANLHRHGTVPKEFQQSADTLPFVKCMLSSIIFTIISGPRGGVAA